MMYNSHLHTYNWSSEKKRGLETYILGGQYYIGYVEDMQELRLTKKSLLSEKRQIN